MSDAAALLGGLATGALGAYAYYSPALRPLAHAFTLWIALLAAVVPGARDGRAILRAAVALAAAVVAFYYGKDVMYGIRYPGMPYSVNLEQLALWLVLAALAGTAAGLVFGPIGREDVRGTVSTALAAGLLIGEVVRRSDRADGVVFTVATLLALALVLARGIRSRRQAVRVAAWLVPMALAGFLLVSGPDVLEQLLLG
ncbi:hypothetical protein SAMN04489727_6206 [Amycolatopsis tolypomycina]|uniref:Uncharacterized protein n=2 Tax=Amycolatopsis tolypomycina TaxID=208445 RepID=A0A1H4XL27_9PSEU|nr:hypothetical protein SAMN04489727_6206 [Amycolatopsis tolypomycina]